MANKESAPATFGAWLKSPLAVLSLFLVLIFFTGGTSFPQAQQLAILRPAALLVAAFGLYGMRAEHWRQYWAIWAIFGAALALTVAHLVPLPYAWWTSLPGRGVIAEIDAAVGFGKIARPLSMHPEATVNALVSLAIPLAVLSLAVRLDEAAQRRLASVLLGLILLSALVGVLQLSGAHIALYNNADDLHPSGLFNNRNHQGALLAVTMPLAALAWRGGYGWDARHAVERFAAAALAIFVLPLAVVTGSRSGLFLTVAGLALALLAVPVGAANQRARLTAIARYVSALAVLALVLWLTMYASRDVAFERLADANEDLRYPLWRSVVDAIPAYWPWGTGVGTFVDAYQVLEPDTLLRQTYYNHAHNEWLEIAFTAGIPGLALLGAAFVATVAAAFRVMRSQAHQHSLARVGLIIIIILAFASTSDYPVRTPIMSAVLAIAAVWAARLQSAEARQGAVG